MQTIMIKREGTTFLRRLRFPPEVERAFQASYYERIRPTLRVGLFFLAVLSVGSAILHVTIGSTRVLQRVAAPGTLVTHSVPSYTLPIIVIAAFVVAALNLLLLGFAFHRKFAAVWQPCVVGTTLISLVPFLTTEDRISSGFFVFYLLLIGCRMQRLQLRWMAFQLCGLLALGTLIELVRAPKNWDAALGTTILSLLLMSVPLLFTFRSERFERGEFWAKHVLAEERNDERQKREQSEQMLHVLSQAIGGIVHDLGNPLTSVQTGAETLRSFVKSGHTDPELMIEFADIITDGAQMLNYLRLSLMEQTRVLEGKPVPVELKPTSLRHLVQSGAHYQKPKFASGRTVSVVGEDLEVCVDEMRFVTIFMNLIGNALKYSEGEVRIVWRAHGEQALIAVMDQGRAGQGITQAQAEKLFVAFGRLDTHAQVEGTGLGLLSVRKIAEAHEGEVYIEGYTTGVAGAASFSTAQGTYPPLLENGFCTAFVAVCPLSGLSDHRAAYSSAPDKP